MVNGNPWADVQIDISALGSVTDKFVYLVRDIPAMQLEFPSTTFDSSNTVVVGDSTNGDDGYQIVLNGTVVSQFGKTETDADLDTDSNWNHEDAVATRTSGVADLGTWNPAHWTITAENDLDANTACQNSGTTNLETYFATLGGTFPLGSGSGWTPTPATCTTVLNNMSTNCDTTTAGSADDTYTALIDFSGGDNGNTFVVSATSGTVGGDNPTAMASGTITISGIAEGTDVTVTVSDTADGGVCNLSTIITSPACIPLIINEVLFDPASDDPGTTEIEGDANGDAVRDALADEFIEFYNNSSAPLDISGYTISDIAALRHTFPPSTVIPANGVLIVFGGSTPTGTFGGAIVQTASEGELNLSNGGDIITVRNPSGTEVVVFDSSSIMVSVSSDQSVTRSPDITGNFVLHTGANASLSYSPGLMVSGAVLTTEQFQIPQFSLYPNPVVNGLVTINGKSPEKLNVSIFDILGKRVRSATVANNEPLDVSNLKSGMYILQIEQNNTVVSKKLVIK
jgi:hypothetical protein